MDILYFKKFYFVEVKEISISFYQIKVLSNTKRVLYFNICDRINDFLKINLGHYAIFMTS